MSSETGGPPGNAASEPFVAGLSSIKRNATGSEFRVSSMPPDLRRYDCEDQNPDLELKVGFDALSIVERVPTEPGDKFESVKIWTGFLLAEGHLYSRLCNGMTLGLRRTASYEELDRSTRACLDDCHELMLEYLHLLPARFHWHPIFSPGIYEADALALRHYLASDSQEVRRAADIHLAGPDIVVGTGAKRIR